jgi:hypothetical protein
LSNFTLCSRAEEVVDLRKRLYVYCIIVGLAVAGLLLLVVSGLCPSFNPEMGITIGTFVIYSWSLVAVFFGATYQDICVLVLRAFDDDRDAFLAKEVGSSLEYVGRVEALRPPQRVRKSPATVSDSEVGSIAATDSDWKSVVENLLVKSKLIVFDASNVTPNCKWEWDQITTRFPEKTIIVAHSDATGSEAAKAIRYSTSNLTSFRQALRAAADKRCPKAQRSPRAWLTRFFIDSSKPVLPRDAVEAANRGSVLPVVLVLTIGLVLSILSAMTAVMVPGAGTGEFVTMAATAGIGWIAIVGAVLPPAALSRPEVWTVFRRFGFESIAGVKMVARPTASLELCLVTFFLLQSVPSMRKVGDFVGGLIFFIGVPWMIIKANRFSKSLRRKAEKNE